MNPGQRSTNLPTGQTKTIRNHTYRQTSNQPKKPTSLAVKLSVGEGGSGRGGAARAASPLPRRRLVTAPATGPVPHLKYWMRPPPLYPAYRDPYPAFGPDGCIVDGVRSGRCVVLPVGHDARFLAWPLLRPAGSPFDVQRWAVGWVAGEVAENGRGDAVVRVIRCGTVLSERIPLVDEFQRPMRRTSF